MQKYHIELSAEETELLETIDLSIFHSNHDEGHTAYNANKQPILKLLERLADRSAIPEERARYWNDPKYNIGGRKTSRKGVFEKNGCIGEDIYTHPHFIPHLRYFLFGADLSDPVVVKFEEKVGNPNWVTSSDIVPIGKCARDLAREYGLERNAAAEEFFKLCLDMDLGLDNARSVRQAVMKLR